MSEGPTIAFKLGRSPSRGSRGRGCVQSASGPPGNASGGGRVPRVARLLALAIRIDELIRRGEIADMAEAARLGHVTRARMSQIMDLLNLAPDIQVQLLSLPLVVRGRDPLSEPALRALTKEVSWERQRHRWETLRGDSGPPHAALV